MFKERKWGRIGMLTDAWACSVTKGGSPLLSAPPANDLLEKRKNLCSFGEREETKQSGVRVPFDAKRSPSHNDALHIDNPSETCVAWGLKGGSLRARSGLKEPPGTPPTASMSPHFEEFPADNRPDAATLKSPHSQYVEAPSQFSSPGGFPAGVGCKAGSARLAQFAPSSMREGLAAAPAVFHSPAQPSCTPPP